ncbi:hypothetical protein CEUSTIGMA_g3508.t1 [Chlamydomonas eustigma]|uniref:Uncharacterized protein n=1 Tax=Chlamydomonas eustigma TaxID=1157962 RepID=A0A250WZ55_9CHLO|nr:hypothetical protein CEUSTIGMA_g3508.t1 [Chlamydomonas eustigma]|eukprot:GAX76065.1 hypothetical protein CEUSTIGMA_g3508.t1 [Chlamydomonas eustigma]
MKKSNSTWIFALLLVVWLSIMALSFFYLYFDQLPDMFNSTPSIHQGKVALIVYLFAANDPEYMDNLKFFVHEAIRDDEKSCDYIIILQDYKIEHEEEASASQLPELPSNAKYVRHANECYDWGTFGWLLRSSHVNIKGYTYFFFINSSVRGPFLPAYARGNVHWTLPFINRLKGDTKLVGPTISCEGSPLNGDVRGKWRRNPHVQSYALATDRVGLRLLMRDRTVFHCHQSRWNTIYYSELGSSAAVLAAGYNIDSFMTRYQGVDWRDPAHWGCNERLSPQGEYFYDGITLDPLEVMFVKVKSYTLQNGVSSANKAVKYQQWLHPDVWPMNFTSGLHGEPGEGSGDETDGPEGDSNPLITSNEYMSDTPRFKIPRVLEAKARGPSCFDFDFYSEHNSDLRNVNSNSSLWRHYVYFGQFESRPYRFTCPFDYSVILSMFT